MDAPASLRRLIAALLVVRASGHLLDSQRRYPQWELPNAELRQLLDQGVGGVILLGGSAPEVALRCEQLQSWARLPLLLCADVEEGVGQRFEGASWLPPPLAIGRLFGKAPQQACALAERHGRCTGREARALGLNWVLGPVCDVNNNPANPVINVRAWGEDPSTAAALAAAFVRGVRAEGVLSCAKHFPGHGDTSDDSHLALPLLPHSRERLNAVELPPFAACIAAGVDAVMTGHLVLPALDAERPATLSKALLTDLLRHDLGFNGLVVTDALVMEAISGHYGPAEAAVLALEAGADLVLMPADAQAAIHAIAAAVEAGRLSLGQLEASAERRQRALASLPGPSLPDPSLPATSLTTANLIAELETSPAGALLGDEILPSEILNSETLISEILAASLDRQGGVLAPAPGPGINLVRLENLLQAPQAVPRAPALEAPAALGYRACLLEPRSPSPWQSEANAPLALERLGEGPVLLQLFVRGNPFRGHSAATEPWPAVVGQLQACGRLAGVVVYGSPYLWESLQAVLEPTIPAAYSPGQMPLAQALALASLVQDQAPEVGVGARDAAIHADFTD